MKVVLYQLLFWLTIFSLLLVGCEREKKEFIQPSPKVESPIGISPNGFIAQWVAFPSIDYYLLDIALDSDFENKLSDEYPVAVKDNFHEVQNLIPSTIYYYRVGAKTLSGSTIAYSAIQEVATSSLSSPVAYEPTDVGISQITAIWSSVKEADGYKVELSSQIDFDSILETYEKANNLDTILVIDNLEEKQGYFYRIRSTKGDYYSLPSNTIYSTTTNLEKPILTGIPEVQYTSIAFQWEEVAFADSYEVEISTDPLFDLNSAPVFSTDNIFTLQATVDGLNANTYYYYRVRAKQDTSFSGYSSTLKVKTKSLGIPQILSPDDIGTSQFTVSWAAVTDAEAYEVDLATDSSFRSTLAVYSALHLTELSFLFTDLKPNTTYYLRVRAQGFNAYSDFSEVLTVSTAPLTAPGILEVTTKNLNTLILEWSQAEGAESYLLSIATNSTFTEYLAGYEQKEIIGNIWEVQNTDPLQAYYVGIKSKNGTIVSSEETVIYITAPIPSTCVLSKKSWDDGWVESYAYNGMQVTSISGDSAGIARYNWELFYEGEKLVKANKYEAEALDLLALSEIWLFGYQDTLWVSLHRQDKLSNTLEYTTLSYDANGKVIQVSRYTDELATTLNSQENYTYSEGTIVEARDDANQLIKTWKYTNDYNPAYRFSPAIHSLLYDPGMSASLGFVAPSVTSFYQQLVNDIWEKQAYVYETNQVGMPTKLYPGNDLPIQSYIFSSCGF